VWQGSDKEQSERTLVTTEHLLFTADNLRPPGMSKQSISRNGKWLPSA